MATLSKKRTGQLTGPFLASLLPYDSIIVERFRMSVAAVLAA